MFVYNAKQKDNVAQVLTLDNNAAVKMSIACVCVTRRLLRPEGEERSGAGEVTDAVSSLYAVGRLAREIKTYFCDWGMGMGGWRRKCTAEPRRKC